MNNIHLLKACVVFLYLFKKHIYLYTSKGKSYVTKKYMFLVTNIIISLSMSTISSTCLVARRIFYFIFPSKSCKLNLWAFDIAWMFRPLTWRDILPHLTIQLSLLNCNILNTITIFYDIISPWKYCFAFGLECSFGVVWCWFLFKNVCTILFMVFKWTIINLIFIVEWLIGALRDTKWTRMWKLFLSLLGWSRGDISR